VHRADNLLESCASVIGHNRDCNHVKQSVCCGYCTIHKNVSFLRYIDLSQFLHVVLVLSVVEKIKAGGSGPLNPHHAGSILHAAQCYVASGDNMNEKNLLTLSQAKPS
jgi:hypothetical protein